MRIGTFTKFIWLAWTICAFSFATRPNPYAQLGIMLLVFIILRLIISGFIRAARNVAIGGFKGFFIPILSLLVLIIPFCLGFAARMIIFKWKLPQYQLAADWVERQTFDSKSSYINLDPPDEFKGLSYGIHAKRSATCGTVIWFFWGDGFPVKHTARIFSSIDSLANPECLGDWHKPRKLAEYWYEASD